MVYKGEYIMTNLVNKVKEVIKNHKKIAVSVLVLLLVSAISVGYILSNKNTSVNTNSEKTVETSTKKEDKKSDEKKNEVKIDKKNETKKQEEKKEEVTSETKTEETTTSTSNNTSAVENNSVSNSTSTTNNSTASQPTTAPCVPTYTTVNHPEQGHYETQVVMPAWDEPVYAERIVGLGTGRIYNSLEEWGNHIDEDGNYAVKRVQVDTIHHDAETQQVWVVDQPAWTETVASGC